MIFIPYYIKTQAYTPTELGISYIYNLAYIPRQLDISYIYTQGYIPSHGYNMSNSI